MTASTVCKNRKKDSFGFLFLISVDGRGGHPPGLEIHKVPQVTLAKASPENLQSIRGNHIPRPGEIHTPDKHTKHQHLKLPGAGGTCPPARGNLNVPGNQRKDCL